MACDNARYECDAPGPALAFRPTLMFATRAHVLRLANTGQARLDYAWRVMNADGTEDASGAAPKRLHRGLHLPALHWVPAMRHAACRRMTLRWHRTRTGSAREPPLLHRPHAPLGLYTVSPPSGSIAAGTSEEITLRFSPVEVEECERLLVCDIPDLEASCQPLRRAVTGKVGAGEELAALSSRHASRAHEWQCLPGLLALNSRTPVGAAHRSFARGATLSCLTVITSPAAVATRSSRGPVVSSSLWILAPRCGRRERRCDGPDVTCSTDAATRASIALRSAANPSAGV